MKLKVLTIVGTRPELIKLSRIIAKLDEHTQHVLVHTGQNFDYELNQVFFDDMKIRKPDYFLNSAGDTAIQTIANVLVASEKVIISEKPDAMVIYGDTNSCLSVIVAKKYKVPIFHLEAGNRCFDQRVPEELNRKIVDHLSDINMPLSEHARNYLVNEGIRPEQVIKTGSCMPEILDYYKESIEKSKVLSQLSLTKGSYIVVSLHREENVDYIENFTGLLTSLNLLANQLGKKILVSTHPRTAKKIEQLKDVKFSNDVSFLKPFGFFDYITLQTNAYCVISDSGTITEESAILKFPAITVRNAHERPEGMDAGTLIMAGTKPDFVLRAVQLAVQLKVSENVPDYQSTNVSDKVLKIILSYTPYINRTVWSKDL